MSRGRKIILVGVIVFTGIQFIQPAKNKKDGGMQSDLISYFKVPENVANILSTSCYDCHSNNTRYPWYASIQPIGWFLAKHIKDGKEALNFNAFGSLSQRRQQSKIKAINNSIQDGSMPLASYLLFHPNAKLTREDKALVTEWATKTAEVFLSKIEAGRRSE